MALKIVVGELCEGADISPIKSTVGSSEYEVIGDSYTITSDDVTNGTVIMYLNTSVIVSTDSDTTILGVISNNTNDNDKYPCGVINDTNQTIPFYRLNSNIMKTVGDYSTAIGFLGTN